MLLLKILLIGLLVFFPFAEVLRFSDGNNIYFTPIDAISVLLCLWTTVYYLKNKALWVHLKWYYFLFPGVGLISLLINTYWLKPNEFVSSLLYLIRWLSYLSIFFAIRATDALFKKKIVKGLIIDGILIVLFGYIQYFFYSQLQNLYYLGWDEQLYRMFSTFLDPNFAGAFFVLYLLFIAGLVFPHFKKYPRKKIILSILLLIATLVAVCLTFSRSALVMLVISGITFFVLLQKKKYILGLLGFLVTFIIVISPFFYLENINLFRHESSIERLNSAESTLVIIKGNPIIGVGFDTYRYAQIKYHFIKPTSPYPSNAESSTDASLLFVFATTGIIGLGAYGFLWYKQMQFAYKERKLNPFALIFFVSAVGILFNSLFIDSLFYEEIMLWFWMVSALMYKK